jgi:hypothetical protein
VWCYFYNNVRQLQTTVLNRYKQFLSSLALIGNFYFQDFKKVENVVIKTADRRSKFEGGERERETETEEEGGRGRRRRAGREGGRIGKEKTEESW